MTKEDKDLLLKDLCARLPYGVVVNYSGLARPLFGITPTQHFQIALDNALEGEHNGLVYVSLDVDGEEPKPYLRPMSSMTDEEKEELKSKCIHTETEEDWEGVRCDVWGIQILDKYDTRRWDNPIWPSIINMDAIDWLNKNHFDYRGLIEKELAIEVTKDNNPYKD